MTQILDTYRWYVDHPLELLALFGLVLGAAWIIGAVIFAALAWRHERKQEAERQKFERMLRACTPPKDWPSRPGPKGFERRVS